MMVVSDDFERDDLGWAMAPTPVPRDTCPRPELLRAEAEGVLPEEVAERIRVHVARCDLCRRLRASLLEIDIEPPAVDEERRVRVRITRARRGQAVRRGLRTWTPALAAAAVVAVAVWLPRPTLPPLPPHPQPAGSLADTRRPPLPGEVLVARAPALELPATVVPSRGGAEAVSRRVAFALEPYGAGNYEEAARRLGPLSVEAPTNAQVHFYLGVSRLLAGDAQSAVAPLLAARRLDEDRFGTESTWYLALAHQQTGRDEAAVTELTRLCGRRVAYGVEACAALEALSFRSS